MKKFDSDSFEDDEKELKFKLSIGSVITSFGFWFITLICVLVIVFTFAYSGSKDKEHEEDLVLVEDTELKSADNNYEFYLNSFDSLMSKNSDNLVYSPYSEKLCLTLVLNGMDTESESYNQLSSAMGYNTSDLNEVYSNIELSKSSLAKKDDVLVSNSIWYDKEVSDSKNSDYFDNMKKNYEADTFEVDLSSYDFVKSANSYVADKTNRMINMILQEPLSDDAKLMLMNVLYMNSKWYYEFLNEDTYADTFNDDEKVMFMHQSTKFEYAHDKGLEMLKLPYTNDLEMVLIKSDSDKDTYEVWNNLSLEDRVGIINDSEYSSDTTVDLSLPKFEVKSTLNLKKSLVSLGVCDIFKNEINSIPNIVDDESLFLSDVIQSVKLRCDEEGTEAAAVTIAIVKCDSLALEPETIEYNVNKPFMYIIRDKESGDWLFMGYMKSIVE